MIRRLLQEARKFGLFQAIRLIELQTLWNRRQGKRVVPVGFEANPELEGVRFAGAAKTRFAGAEVDSVREVPTAGPGGDRTGSRWKLTTTALSLTGPTGALPRHYTTLLQERLKQHDRAMAHFLDLFNHRSVTLFYRAWTKNRLPISYEGARLHGGYEDTPTAMLHSLVGQGIAPLRRRSLYDDRVLLVYAGLFSSVRRAANGLETILQTLLKLEIRVEQFQPQWLNLEWTERTQLGGATLRERRQSQLGRTAICGERVFDMQSRFRVVLRTRSHREFLTFLPDGQKLELVCQLTRRYVGMEFDFDVQVELPGEQIPACQLANVRGIRPQLGRNTWLRSQPLQGRVGDAVFAIAETA